MTWATHCCYSHVDDNTTAKLRITSLGSGTKGINGNITAPTTTGIVTWPARNWKRCICFDEFYYYCWNSYFGNALSSWFASVKWTSDSWDSNGLNRYSLIFKPVKGATPIDSILPPAENPVAGSVAVEEFRRWPAPMTLTLKSITVSAISPSQQYIALTCSGKWEGKRLFQCPRSEWIWCDRGTNCSNLNFHTMGLSSGGENQFEIFPSPQFRE